MVAPCEFECNGTYIYLIHVRENVRCKENVYKVGYSDHFSQRVRSYKKGSCLMWSCRVANGSGPTAEGAILDKFKDVFKQRREFGTEYFEGNYKQMIATMQSIALTFIDVDLPVVVPVVVNQQKALQGPDAMTLMLETVGGIIAGRPSVPITELYASFLVIVESVHAEPPSLRTFTKDVCKHFSATISRKDFVFRVFNAEFEESCRSLYDCLAKDEIERSLRYINGIKEKQAM